MGALLGKHPNGPHAICAAGKESARALWSASLAVVAINATGAAIECAKIVDILIHELKKTETE